MVKKQMATAALLRQCSGDGVVKVGYSDISNVTVNLMTSRDTNKVTLETTLERRP